MSSVQSHPSIGNDIAHIIVVVKSCRNICVASFSTISLRFWVDSFKLNSYISILVKILSNCDFTR